MMTPEQLAEELKALHYTEKLILAQKLIECAYDELNKLSEALAPQRASAKAPLPSDEKVKTHHKKQTEKGKQSEKAAQQVVQKEPDPVEDKEALPEEASVPAVEDVQSEEETTEPAASEKEEESQVVADANASSEDPGQIVERESSPAPSEVMLPLEKQHEKPKRNSTKAATKQKGAYQFEELVTKLQQQQCKKESSLLNAIASIYVQKGGITEAGAKKVLQRLKTKKIIEVDNMGRVTWL